MRLHTGEKPYACTRCNFRTSDSSRLLKHNRAHDLDTPHKCTICGLGFLKALGLVCHMRLTHGVVDFESDFGEVTNLNKLKVVKKGKPVSSYKCDVCGQLSASRVQHVQHRSIHTGERPLACTKCAYRARQYLSLKVHMKSHVGMESKELGCNDCTFRTNYYAVLSRHCRLFHSKSENTEKPTDEVGPRNIKPRQVRNTGPWKCHKCDFVAATRAKLETHRKLNHGTASLPLRLYTVTEESGERKLYRCSKCLFNCAVQPDMIEHLKIHQVRRHSCHLCPFKAMIHSSLMKHFRVVHKIMTPYKCTECEFSSSKFIELAVHKKTHKKLNNKLRCKSCSFFTSSESQMKRHRNFHNGIRFPCSICGFMFYDANEYNQHQAMHGNRSRQSKHMFGKLA